MAIVSCLVDTNVLLRVARGSIRNTTDYTALAKLALEGATLHYTHQNIAELWNVMTRPVAATLGLTVATLSRSPRD